MVAVVIVVMVVVVMVVIVMVVIVMVDKEEHNFSVQKSDKINCSCHNFFVQVYGAWPIYFFPFV